MVSSRLVQNFIRFIYDIIKRISKHFPALFTLLLAYSFILLSCSAKSDRHSKNEKDAEKGRLETVKNKIDVPESILANGKKVYLTYCSACHQADGSGNPGMYPPLDGTDMVNGGQDELIKIILAGLSGPLEVKGEIYNQFMAPHNFLSDNDIADLLTYIRNSFGNASTMITKEQVSAVREKLN